MYISSLFFPRLKYEYSFFTCIRCVTDMFVYVMRKKNKNSYSVLSNIFKEMILKIDMHCYFSISSLRKYESDCDTHLYSGSSESMNICGINSYFPFLLAAVSLM